MNRWYLTPGKMAKMSEQPDLFWCCGYGGTGYFHMCWLCPKLQLFCPLVAQALSQIIGVEVPINPRLMLLAGIDHFQLDSRRVRLANVLIAASLLIAKSCRLHGAPELKEWINKIISIFFIE